ncbi:stage II sporulation protein M [Nanoarchaeota archaeon]
MVLEEFFKVDLKRRPYFAFFFGFAFSLAGLLAAYLLFRSTLSVAMVFFTTMLLVPAFVKLIKEEEQLESRHGLKHFFTNHKGIYESYIFAFLGVFSAFVIIGMITYGTPLNQEIFSFQSDFLKVGPENVEEFMESEPYSASHFISLSSHNLIVLVVCFVLSFIFGASAIFLIILNGSIFASFIVFLVKTLTTDLAQSVKAIGFFLIHLLPEISGFMIAAIAGGVISKAIMHEQRGTIRFQNVFKDAFVLMLIATMLILVGAFLETFVSSTLFRVSF